MNEPTFWQKLFVFIVVSLGTIAAIKLAMLGIIGVFGVCK